MDPVSPPADTPGNNISQAQATQAAGERFDAALSACIEGWNRGDDVVILQDNLLVLFGDLLVQHFQRTVGEALGTPVDLTVMDGGDRFYTLVKFSEAAHPVQTPTSELAAIDMHAIAAGLKKAPRPMNCWIIFRDAMHKQLKAEHPDLSVQQICKYTNYPMAQLDMY